MPKGNVLYFEKSKNTTCQYYAVTDGAQHYIGFAFYSKREIINKLRREGYVVSRKAEQSLYNIK